MADMSGKIAQIKALIDNESYFTINRARQYGKTTALFLLEKELQGSYIPVSMSFEGLGDGSFESQEAFCAMFIQQIVKALKFTEAAEEYIREWADNEITTFGLLSEHITKMCEDKKVVLIIYEVDRTSNNRVFLQFIGMLRNKFLAREAGEDYTFHSVILAGVYDIRNIKLKMINEGAYTPMATEGKILNSPWNIAIQFNVDMSFNPAEISVMLNEYEKDHNTGMSIAEISEEIHKYTSGYPFLVSRVCQCVDEERGKDWTISGLQNAMNFILQEENLLFDDLSKNLESNKELYEFLYALLIVGERKSFNIGVPVIRLGSMYGYIKKGNGNKNSMGSGYAAISNKIFEIRMSNYFIAKDANANRIENAVCGGLIHDVVKGGKFNMELALRKFAEHYNELFNKTDIEFLERHGRLIFLSYLKPLINGRGFYHIESQFTDLRRMDVIVDFGKDQFIVELKLWHGDKYKQEAYKQLIDYLNSKNADTGYMLTFDFRKNANKQTQAEWVETESKRIFDVVV
jgi:hypothetical protein